jgi:hypothetical protein
MGLTLKALPIRRRAALRPLDLIRSFSFEVFGEQTFLAHLLVQQFPDEIKRLKHPGVSEAVENLVALLAGYKHALPSHH